MKEDKLSLETIRSQIRETKAEWKAARTSLSELGAEDQKNRLGLLPSQMEMAAISKFGYDTETTSRILESKPIKYISRPAGIPSAIDWKDINGVDWTTPVKNQGNCGSCVGFGTVATLEALLKISNKNSEQAIDLSEAHLLWCGGGSCNGWHMDNACEYLKLNGVPDEACFPYKPKTMSCKNTCSDWAGRINGTKIQGWANTKDINTMKADLVNGPLITGMAVYNDFFSYKSGVYKHAAGDLAGYHCVCVVGYNDDDECWICKNSWGTDWGEGGFFRIGYGECGIEDAFGMWKMQVQEAEGEEGDAEHIAVEYSFTTSTKELYAYAGNKWRHKQISEDDVLGLANLMMESPKVIVRWKGDELTFVRCYK